MCGILGVLLKDSDSILQKNFQISHAMEVLKPRGPDYSKTIRFNNVVLGHTRLAIVNPSSGAQPMVGDEWILTVNAEIYNHKRLQDQDITMSDCDVILNKLENGVPPSSFLPKLEGMFSFVAYNITKDTMIVARDRTGITPLYVAEVEGSYWACSLLRAFPKNSKPRIVMPGTVETFKRSDESISWASETWAKPYVTNNIDKFYCRRTYRRLLQSAVQDRVMQGDTPWGVLLSGGLDSSIVAALACKLKNPNYPVVHSFCIGLSGSPDLEAAKVVANHLGTVHHSIVYTVEDTVHHLEDVIRDVETYDITTVRASIPMWLLGRELKRYNIKYVLSGEGSDESWGGYLYNWHCPSPEEMTAECVRKLDRLHAFDCLRANKSLAAHGVECRVPFLSPEVLKFTMENVHSIHKMSKSHPEMARIEKFDLRSMFQYDLPVSIITRTKAQFSDAVGEDHIAALKSHAESQIDDELFEKRPDFIHTKEGMLYYALFRDMFYNIEDPTDAVLTEPVSIACSTEHAMKWNTSFSAKADPSGESVKEL